MKLMTNKEFQHEIEQRLHAENERRWTSERFDRLEKRMYEMECRISELEEKVRRLSGEEPKANLADKCFAVPSSVNIS